MTIFRRSGRGPSVRLQPVAVAPRDPEMPPGPVQPERQEAAESDLSWGGAWMAFGLNPGDDPCGRGPVAATSKSGAST